jgi:hypothetical protein
MATLFPGIAKFLSKSSEFSAWVFTVVLCMIATDTQGISAMTTSLERTLAADLAECLELDAACRRVFQAAAALRTDNKRSVLAVKRTARDLKLCSWMISCIHSISRTSLTASATKQKLARRAARLCCLANVRERNTHELSALSAVLCIDRVCRDCNIHDRMSFRELFYRSRDCVACGRGAYFTAIAYAGVCVTKPSLLESRNDIW